MEALANNPGFADAVLLTYTTSTSLKEALDLDPLVREAAVCRVLEWKQAEADSVPEAPRRSED